jgi:hypothetical protein
MRRPMSSFGTKRTFYEGRFKNGAPCRRLLFVRRLVCVNERESVAVRNKAALGAFWLGGA